MTLPDSAFLELMRSVFGNIKTPFTKQRLLNDLFALLCREEIRGTIAAYLDEADHRVMAAIALLQEPAPGELESFFSGELSYADLHALLVNLEERLILYRPGEGGDRRLALNPVLEPILAPLIADRDLLFPSFPLEKIQQRASRKEKPAPAFVHDGRFMASLFAFISGEDDFFKAEGGIRKKVLDEGKLSFPGLDLELAVGALCQLGLFRAEGERLLADDQRIEGFAALSGRDRNEYWMAGVFLQLHDADPVLNGLSRGRVRMAASFIHRFCLLLDPGLCYPRITLRRFGELVGHEDSGSGMLWGYRIHESKVKLPFELLMDTLIKTGLLAEAEGKAEPLGGLWKTGPFFISPREASPSPEDPTPAAEKPVIVMDTAFSFILYPEVSFADALALARFCSIKPGTRQQETALCFELTRSSAVRGFDRGLGSDAMLELLGRLSGNRLDGSLAWTLKDWEARYEAVSLHQGLVLTLTEDRRYLAEAKPVASLIRKTLAPGVYLLAQGEGPEASKELAAAREALQKAGVDIVAQPSSAAGEMSVKHAGTFFAPLTDHSAGREGPPRGSASQKSSKPDLTEADSIKEKFRRVLRGMKISKSERDELSARIERRLVLSEAQLEGASIKYEKLEARGLDYVGKAAIAKQAIASGSLLEVSWPGPEGEINRTIGIPSALEKKDGESVLILKSLAGQLQGAGESGEKEVRLLLGKISLMRRIKRSIFET
jgi:hypothetical protein